MKFVFSTLLLAAASPALALGVGGNTLPRPFYTNGYDVTAYKLAAGNRVTTRAASVHTTGAISVTDPAFTLAADANPTPYVRAVAHGGNGLDAMGGGTIVYFFSVSGPNRLVVPLSAHIVIDARAGGSAGSFEHSGGNVNVFTDLTSVSRQTTASFGGASPAVGRSTLDEIVSFTATANDSQYSEIEIIGEATIAEAPGQRGYAKLLADPVLTIDPTWALANPGYRLTFSPGVGNQPGATTVTGAPEPATWALMVGGFGLVGGLARRRRASVAV